VQSLVGHVIWQGRPAQPSALQQLPLTLTLTLDGTPTSYPNQATDASGYFTVTTSGLPDGTYTWQIKGPQYLSNSGQFSLERLDVSIVVDMGLMRTGDANDDNLVTVGDFNILKVAFGTGIGTPGFDPRADFTGDEVINVSDFNLVKNNFGTSGD
jgi:hypothetical protein